MVNLTWALLEKLKRPEKMDRRTLKQKYPILNFRNNNLLPGIAVIGSIAVAIGFAVFYPMLNSDNYKKIQKKNREEMKLNMHEIQPGDMRVWSDPFNKRPE